MPIAVASEHALQRVRTPFAQLLGPRSPLEVRELYLLRVPQIIHEQRVERCANSLVERDHVRLVVEHQAIGCRS